MNVESATGPSGPAAGAAQPVAPYADRATCAVESHPAAGVPPEAIGKKQRKDKPGSQSAPSSLTPGMRQYLEQKAQVGDALLLFRMGDFYETFYDDAKTVARVAGLTLTARNKNTANPIPLAGVPYHAVDGYIAKLVRAGYKVAISEQAEDPKKAKGLVKRELRRIITPGTLTDETLLDERRPNYLAALCPGRGGWGQGPIGLACVELSSGRFFAQMLPAAAVEDELARLRPAEVLVPETDIDADTRAVETMCEVIGASHSARPTHVFDPHMAERSLLGHFGVTNLAGFGFDAFDPSLCAAAVVLDYLRETQKAALSHVLKIVPRTTDQCVMIDQVALRSLEVERTLREGARAGSLLDAVDETVNAMGARRLREWLCFPLNDVDAIISRQDAISALRGEPDRLRRLRDGIREMGDLERIIARLGVGRASPRDVVVLGEGLLRCRRLSEAIGPAVADGAVPDLLTRLATIIGGLDPLGSFLTTALKEDAPPVLRDGGYIADGHDAELDRLRNIEVGGRQWLAEFQARQVERTGIPSLKVGYNSVFGYYIEITHQHRDKAPPDYVRKQTVRNAERYITDELKRHENEVLTAADRAKALEFTLFEAIRDRALAELAALQAAADAVATLDVLGGLAELSRRRSFCRPEIIPDEAGVLDIVDGRHPVLDVTLAERFVPNDCHCSKAGDRLLLITGPNMAGKSTYIRQVALLVLLAHTGSYVPAKSMRWSPVDRIFARVGASDELARGLSTFMVEMVETTRILHNATARSLVILDEIGRGTSTYDGLSIAWAITEHIADRIGCRALFATHYHELTDLEKDLPGVANFNVAVREQLRPDGCGRDVVFLHKIVPGPADRSYGVHVAAMAGMPVSVTKRSEAILSILEQGFTGRTRVAQRPAGGRESSGQMLLFGESEPLPAWWRELVDALGGVDIERTTPLEAMSVLQTLKELLHKET